MDEIRGLVAWRMWRAMSLLMSSHRDTIGWPGSVWSCPMTSDNIPSASNNSGLYAFDLESPLTDNLLNDYLSDKDLEDHNKSIGIVELRGKILLHRDNIIRAEWARPILIWVSLDSNVRWMERLYQAYHCQIISTDNFVMSFNKWLSAEGRSFIEQNKIKKLYFGKTAEEYYGIPKIASEKYKNGQPASKINDGDISALIEKKQDIQQQINKIDEALASAVTSDKKPTQNKPSLFTKFFNKKAE